MMKAIAEQRRHKRRFLCGWPPIIRHVQRESFSGARPTAPNSTKSVPLGRAPLCKDTRSVNHHPRCHITTRFWSRHNLYDTSACTSQDLHRNRSNTASNSSLRYITELHIALLLHRHYGPPGFRCWFRFRLKSRL